MEKKHLDIYGIGNAIMDLQVKVSDDEFESLSHSLGFKRGDMTLVSLEQQQELIRLVGDNRFIKAAGGSCANSSILAAQLGAKVAFSGALGSDLNGNNYTKEMEIVGITCSNAVLQDRITGSCAVLITPDAERTMITYLGATSQFDENHVEEDLICFAKYLHVEAYLLASDKGREAVRKAVKLANQFETKIALSLSAEFIVCMFESHLMDLIDSSYVVLGNLDEVKLLTKKVEEDEAFAVLKNMTYAGAMTLGDRGSRSFFGDSVCYVPAPKVKAVDTTGAGDAFAGAFLYGISRNTVSKLEEITANACHIASLLVQQIGPRLKL